jgi:hypothetical protein
MFSRLELYASGYPGWRSSSRPFVGQQNGQRSQRRQLECRLRASWPIPAHDLRKRTPGENRVFGIEFSTGSKDMKRVNPFFSFLTAILLLALMACAPTAKREGTGEYVDDTVITTKVKAALVADPDLKAREINVETFKGTVQLSGFVSSRDDIEKAVTVARNVDGVTAVRNSMVVK